MPPFIPPTLQDDVIHGRGANDAKGKKPCLLLCRRAVRLCRHGPLIGQIASMMFALNKLAETRPELAAQVGLLLTSGEETDHIGMIVSL